MLSQRELYKRWKQYITGIKSEEECQSFEEFVNEYFDEIYHRDKGEFN